MSAGTTIPRPEYPRPQMVREKWINLNGEWQFEMDFGKSGKERKLYEAGSFSKRILVPYCPESKLSGIEYKDFMPAVWYKREFLLPESWKDQKVLLHFGAVDYEAEVWVNGHSAGTHRGGYSSFSFDITGLLKDGGNSIVICAQDDNRSGLQPRGKQSASYYSQGCDYTRTTGVWQTVWLECVPQTCISSFKLVPDPDNCCLHISATLEGDTAGKQLEAIAAFNGTPVGKSSAFVSGKTVSFSLPLSELHLWEPGSPKLYDLKLLLKHSSAVSDSVNSYFGMRTVILSGNAILINHKPVFQRLVLDQGFYPDGIYTAPGDEDLRKDIEISMGLGFNGARLHQKIFEPRFLYWADHMGYLVWGEHGNWGLDITNPHGLEAFLPEWLEALERDFNHPSIVGWCPFNETWDDGKTGARQDNEVLRQVYQVTRTLDKTRPVIDTSGNFHVVTDIYDIHDYEQDPAIFASHYEPMKQGGAVYETFPQRQSYGGQPYFISEYGGIWWNPGGDEKAWGYGQRPKSEEEFLQRYEGLTSTLLNNPRICAFCYTQLYDIEQEVNGLYSYDRKPKFDPAILYRINTKKAAIEELK
jgi:beta-galactosidase/beta-glucuronidase